MDIIGIAQFVIEFVAEFIFYGGLFLLFALAFFKIMES